MIDLDPPRPNRSTPKITGLRGFLLFGEFLVTVGLASGLYGLMCFPIPDEGVLGMKEADWWKAGLQQGLGLSSFGLVWFAVVYIANRALLGRGAARKALFVSILMSAIILGGILLGLLQFVREKPYM